MAISDPTSGYNPTSNGDYGNLAFINQSPEVGDHCKIDLLVAYEFGLPRPTVAPKDNKQSPNKNYIEQALSSVRTMVFG